MQFLKPLNFWFSLSLSFFLSLKQSKALQIIELSFHYINDKLKYGIALHSIALKFEEKLLFLFRFSPLSNRFFQR